MTDATSQPLEGRVALVTGASRGIGAQTARALAADGAAVLLAARTVAQAEAVAADIRDAGGRAEAIACDVADWAQMQGAAAYARDALGGLDILVTISSGAAHHPLEGWSHYCSSKAAAAMLTRAVHLENADQGIRAVGLSPGTVATYMQETIRESRVNPVSALDWSAHIPADWPARAVAWLCGPAGADFAGTEVSLRDEGIRKRLGLLA